MGRIAKWPMGMIAALSLVPVGAAAQIEASSPNARTQTRIQTPAEALAHDAGAYALRYRLPLEEATVRLRALQASAAVTDRIRQTYRDRLVGVSIDHAPTLQIVILLTGTAPVPSTSFAAEGMVLPIVFRTGAAATGDDVIRAMLQRGPELTALVPDNRGMGLDARSGELVILVRAATAARLDLAALRVRAEALTGVKVRFDLADRAVENLALAGGARIEGVHSPDGKRYACTTGFAVTDGTRTGIATAAHCPDEVEYHDPDGGKLALPFAGQWGARTQDVQVNLGPAGQRPLFYA
ncbi:MAG: S1 family peptidase, partial [Pseudomonadota bacterium]|nr:S1 family peptidase [Pseudomonadota bacterium]